MPGDNAEDSVSDYVADLVAQGYDESSASAICKASATEKEFHDTELARMLKEDGASEWVDTVGRMVRSGVEKNVVADVVERARSGADRHEAQKVMAKSDRIEKVGFEAEMSSKFTVFKAGNDDFVIWGPASVEIVDKEGDKIQAKALQKALPQLLKRARLSLEHSDQLVGRILERFETEDDVEVGIDGNSFTRSEFPTDVLELDGMEPALYVAGEIWDDSRQARETRKRIEEGELNSYSISGEALVTQKRVTSEGDTYDDIVDLDLSAVTICEEGMNQEAKFARIDESGEKEAAKVAETTEATAKSDDRNTPVEQGERESPTVSAVASIAKNALNETMSETEKGGDDPDGGFNPEALTSEFKSVLDSKLPDGELATKDDTLTREDVESIAREVYRAEGEDEEVPPEAEEEEEVPAPEEEEDEEPVPEEGKSAVEYVADEHGVDKDALAEFLERGSEEDRDGDDDYDEEGEGEQPGPDHDADDEEKGDEPVPEEDDEEEEEEVVEAEDDEEVPPEAEEEEEAPAPEEEEEEPPEAKEGLSAEELEEKLPADVWEVVREYIDDPEGGEAVEAEPDDEEGEVMEASKSDDIESAVEKILSGSGLEKAEGASAPSGDVEKSYDEQPESDHGNNPALANFYGA